jgi:hypothetical protein
MGDSQRKKIQLTTLDTAKDLSPGSNYQADTKASKLVTVRYTGPG